MKIIKPSDSNVIKVVGKPNQEIKNGRLIHYCVVEEVDEGVLIYNLLTKSMILLTHYEYNHMEEIKELQTMFFWVSQYFDEKTCVDSTRFLLKTIRGKKRDILNYTIFSTTDCNARCFYCYEAGRPRISMDTVTACEVARYITTHSQSQKVKLRWFGGEPLCNIPAIDLICRQLAEQKQSFTSVMITNGFLFDIEIINKAIDLWNLESVQISLDGTEKVYNRSKAFIYDDCNAFIVVLKNITSLLQKGVNVNIRLNLGEHNADDLLNLANKLGERFDKCTNLHVYVHPLFELAGAKKEVKDDVQRSKIYDKMIEIEKELKLYGIGGEWKLDKHFSVNKCMADSNDSITILPNGKIGLCEHHSEGEFIGHISSDTYDKEMVNSWKDCHELLADCSECFYYPNCIRLKKCAEGGICFSQLRNEYLYRIKEAMKNEYDKYLSRL